MAPSLPEFPPARRAWLEWSVLGLCAQGHPLDLFRGDGLPPGTITTQEAERRPGRRARVAGIVAAQRVVPTREGRRMAFVTLEDETGLLECTLFPDAYERHRGVVRDRGPYVAEGRIEEQYGAPSLATERICRVATPVPGTMVPMVGSKVPEGPAAPARAASGG